MITNTLIYGEDDFLINWELKNIIRKLKSSNIIKYDLNETLISDIIIDANTNSLFEPFKTIIIKNSNIFTSKKNVIEQNPNIIENYLNSPNNNTTLIFIVSNYNLDQRKKITKLIKEKGEIRRVEAPKNLISFVSDNLKDYEITNQEISLLIERVGSNLGIIYQELLKLKIYKNENKVITKDDILDVISVNIRPDIYIFIDCIIKKDLDKSLNIYKDLLVIKTEPIAILSLLTSQFRLIYQTKILQRKGFMVKDIASKLNAHPYSIKLAIEKGKDYDDKILLFYLDELAELDLKIKSGLISDKLGMELFIIQI